LELSSIEADMRKDSDIQSLMKDVTEQLGLIDVLVNNAGLLLHRMKAVALDEATWNAILNLNLTEPGHYRCGTLVAPPARPAEARSDVGCGEWSENRTGEGCASGGVR
jgi:NAD(P)-dependent dehydrogenase (short-subunit alcohol dehydrogenase family)